MSKLWFLLSVVLLIQVCRACDDNNEQTARQDSMEYLANAYGFDASPWDSYYYQPNARVPEYAGPYEGRAPFSRPQPNTLPFRNYLSKNNYESNGPESRFSISSLGQSILNAGLFNNRFSSSGTTSRPFAGLANRLPITLNPNYVSPLSTFDACTSPSGESGICSPGAVCSLFGGRPSGSCLLGGVCCINVVTTCGGSVTLNNTYWQSPTTAVSSSSSCALTVKLDTKLVEQKKPICQVRLDFVSFAIDGPVSTGAGAGDCKDTFRVGGASNNVPVICGENTGQHMYLEVPSSDITPTDLQLMFNFGTGTTTRSWNIKIAMLPCGASYLAPTDCLQYFTATSGRVISFNWKDVAVGGTRQLNDQNYNICFRTNKLDTNKASKICLKACTDTADVANPFLLSGVGTPGTATDSLVGTTDCANDFLLIPNGRDSAATPNIADRYCGGSFNPTTALTASVEVCSPIRPFRITYSTDKVETATVDDLNVGFCLTYNQQ